MKKLISELKGKYLGQDIYVMASGKSLDYVDDSFFDNKILLGNNESYFRYKVAYTLAHHKEAVEQALKDNQNVICSEYDCCVSSKPKNDFESYDYWYYKHSEQNHTGEVDFTYFDNDDYLCCCSTTLASTINLAYHMGAKNIIVCGMDSVSINNEINYKGYYRDKAIDSYKNIYHIHKTWEVCLSIVNKIRERGVNVVGFNPFINFKFEGNKVI